MNMRPLFLIIVFALLAPSSVRASGASEDDTLRFAIICDRTGGMRPGVFERAVEKINSLNPEFVMSVGDLIDGYTQTPAVWTAQWDELEAIVKNFKVPFHAVVGNHDISNPKMREAWAHYAFVRKNALFLILDSEDVNGGGFGVEQIAFARKAIADNADVRWTFVFFHRPLWLEKNQNGFEQVADALRGRSYTVFTGHLHHYISAKRRGMEHYVLATSGGDSGLRGEGVGEFDHVTTVTLRPGERPEILNHAVDGGRTMPAGVLTEQYEGRAAALRDGSWLDIAPHRARFGNIFPPRNPCDTAQSRALPLARDRRPRATSGTALRAGHIQRHCATRRNQNSPARRACKGGRSSLRPRVQRNRPLHHADRGL